MKVLMFSTDPKIFVSGSAARSRMQEYAGALGELHIVVLARESGADACHGALSLYPAAASYGIARILRAWRIGRMLCRRLSFDIVTVQSPDEVGLVGFSLARRFRIPLQVQAHTDVMSPWHRRASWKEWIRYRIARFLIPRADCLRVVSERIRHSIVSRISYPVSRITVLPIFTDIARFLNVKLKDATMTRFHGYEFKMVAVGRLVDKEKNFSMLIDMMCDFVKICPTALLVLVGDGPDGENYKLQITNYELERNVILEPWRDDLPSFYKSFDLFLLPSNYEGWGMAVIEAMAAGLPVVMTDVGLAGEVVRDGENGRVAPVRDRKAFLAAVADLYKNSGKRDELAAAGLETVRRILPKTKEEYLKLYKQSFLSCL